MERLYEEAPQGGEAYRMKAAEELWQLLEKRKQASHALRRDYFAPDTTSVQQYKTSVEGYRQQYMTMLGWPLSPWEKSWEAPVEEEFVAEDDLGTIWRLRIPVIEGLHTYGILFVPKSEDPHPLVITQHGGLGTPERVGGFFGSANYNDMVRRVLRRGVMCFAPQLYLWKDEFGPSLDRDSGITEHWLKMLGGSFAALEVRMIMASIDALCRREDVDANRVGMLGLSYGGLYTTLTAAADTRIKVACSSCAFTDTLDVKMKDWGWFGSANRFSLVEIAKLTCPRPLYLEVGDKDELFAASRAEELAPEIAETYRMLGIEDDFCFRVFDGVHELSIEDASIEFLLKYL